MFQVMLYLFLLFLQPENGKKIKTKVARIEYFSGIKAEQDAENFCDSAGTDYSISTE